MKHIIKLIAITLALCTVFAFVSSCSKTDPKSTSEKEKNEASNKEKQEVKNDVVPFDMEQIKWKVEQGLINGERIIGLSYSNHTDVSIVSFELSFREKSDLTQEEKDAFHTAIQALWECDEEEMSELKELPIAMYGESEFLVDLGKSSPQTELCYYEGYWEVKNLGHFDLVEPDIATIRFVEDGKIHTAYYDFLGKKFSKEAVTENAHFWTESPLGDMIPKPDAEVIEKYLLDSEDFFGFSAWGMQFEDFEAYRDLCSKKGFAEDVAQFDGCYVAANDKGYRISIDFEEDLYRIDVSISAPEEESSESDGN